MSQRKQKTARAPTIAASARDRSQYDRALSDAVDFARRTATQARSDARNVLGLLDGATDPRLDRASVAEAVAAILPAFHANFTEALAALDRLKGFFGVAGPIRETEELLARPRFVAGVLSDAGLLECEVAVEQVANVVGLLEERLHGTRHTEIREAGMPATTAEASGPIHSPDFRTVRWGQTVFEFTPGQAACVKLLIECWRRGTPSVGDDYVLDTVGVDSERLSFVFRNHPAFGTLIVEGKTKGTHRITDFFDDQQKQRK